MWLAMAAVVISLGFCEPGKRHNGPDNHGATFIGWQML
jgi:hypothetical protein